MSRSLRACCVHVLAIAWLAFPLAVAAQNTQSTERQATEQQATQTRQHERALAARWDLSMKQWDRYQTLLDGIDGYRADRDKLDPITVLGMNARSAAEQRRYAEKLARLEHERVERVLAFQRAYDAAFKRLYPDEKPVNTDDVGRALAQGPRAASALGLETGTRKAVFVAANDCPACARTVTRLAASRTPIDIFVVDAAGDDDAIRAWARRVGIDATRVRRGAITLNHAPPAAARQLDRQSLPRVIDRQ